MDNYGEIIIYQTEDGLTKLEVKMENDTVWLTQAQLVELYQSSKANVSEHITHIFEEGELVKESVVRKFRTTASDGKNYNVLYYNLDMIISLGYRINSATATKFRQWATQRLKEYIIKGFTIDDERLKGNGGGNYWKELLDRIRDIRSSEKVLYRQVLDLYATSVDYNPKSDESIQFFKIVQNKLHYAAHVETVCLLSKLHEAKHHINVKVDMDELDLTSAEAKATYKEIEEWVQEHYGFHVTNLNIAQVKQKHGIIERENYNKPKSENSRQPGCPEEKVKAIEEALKFFQMI